MRTLAFLGLTTALAAFAAAPVMTSAADSPSIQITNGPVSATVQLPEATEGFYRGTRFDWAGVVSNLTFGGHRYYGPWFTKTDPAVRDFVYDGTDIVAGPNSGITGPVEEFQALGFADAAPGGTFVKIGVGVLRKPMDGQAYSQFRLYDLVDPGARSVRTSVDEAAVEFTHDVKDSASGYGYTYTKRLELTRGRAEMVISHVLKNTGTQPIVTSVYDHNFLVLDGQATSADFVIRAPFDLQTARPPDPAFASLRGHEIVYAKTLVDRDRVSMALTGFGPAAADYDFRIENVKQRAGLRIVGNRPVSSLQLWSIRSVLALEPYIAISVPPGGEFTWSYTYTYYTL